MPPTKANQVSAAVHNRRLAVQLLRDQGPLSRRQLATRTGLRSSTLTYIVRDLAERGIIRVVGKREKVGVGKKQVLLEVNPDLGWVVGVGVETDSASMVLLDAAGSVIDRDRIPLGDAFTMLPQLLQTRLDNWTARRGRPPGKLLGVGVGLPGIVDHERGVILRSTRFQVQDWPLARHLCETFDALSRIDNDSNFAALAEARLGSAASLDNFLYFLINAHEQRDLYAIHSLGSSMFLDGRLYRGSHYSAGEIDTRIEIEPYGTVTAEQLLQIAQADGPLDDALRPVAERMVNSLVALVDMTDPRAVVLGGNLCASNRALLDFIEQEVNQRIVPVPRRYIQVRPSMFMDHGVSMGAAVAVLDAALPANGDSAFQHEAFPALSGAG